MNGDHGNRSLVDGFVERALRLDDDDLTALAAARGACDETFRIGAWRAAMEHAATTPSAYMDAWVRLGGCFVPARLDELVAAGSDADAGQTARWQEVARRARLALDEALLAYVGADSIRPPDIRELLTPWKAMLEEEHSRGGGAE